MNLSFLVILKNVSFYEIVPIENCSSYPCTFLGLNVLKSSEDDWEFVPKAGIATSLAGQFLSNLVGTGQRESGWLFTGLLVQSCRLRFGICPLRTITIREAGGMDFLVGTTLGQGSCLCHLIFSKDYIPSPKIQFVL